MTWSTLRSSLKLLLLLLFITPGPISLFLGNVIQHKENIKQLELFYSIPFFAHIKRIPHVLLCFSWRIHKLWSYFWDFFFLITSCNISYQLFSALLRHFLTDSKTMLNEITIEVTLTITMFIQILSFLLGLHISLLPSYLMLLVYKCDGLYFLL